MTLLDGFLTTNIAVCCIHFVLFAQMSMAFRAEWKQLSPSSKVSPRRSGHISFNANGVPFVFGGYIEEETGKEEEKYRRYVKNDLWKWSTDHWENVEQTGDIPVERLTTAAGVLKDKAYLIGGWNPQAQDGNMFLDTVHELDLKMLSWRKMSATIPDGPSSRHVAVALPDQGKILLFNHRCNEYVWLFDPAKDVFIKQSTTGPCPSSRGLQCATMLDDSHRFVLFGGAAQDGVMSNEAFALDTMKWEWTKVQNDGLCPSPRAGACMCAVDEDHVIVFGGAEALPAGLNPRGDVWLLSLRDQCWELLIGDENESDTVRPPPRNAAVLVEISSQKANEKSFLLMGGWAPFRQTWDDCFVLTITKD